MKGTSMYSNKDTSFAFCIFMYKIYNFCMRNLNIKYKNIQKSWEKRRRRRRMKMKQKIHTNMY